MIEPNDRYVFVRGVCPRVSLTMGLISMKMGISQTRILFEGAVQNAAQDAARIRADAQIGMSNWRMRN